jgi:pyrroline-5-carboxylate reductase
MLKVGILGVGTIAKILLTALDQKEVEAQLVTIWIRIASERKQFLPT